MKPLSSLLLLTLLVGSLFSCENNVEEDTTIALDPVSETPVDSEVPTPQETPNEPQPDTPPTDTPDPNPAPQPVVISFSEDVKPIFDSRCFECHRGNRFPDVRTHASIATNAAIIKSVIVSRRMPLGGSLPNEQIELIRDWIDNGALNN